MMAAAKTLAAPVAFNLDAIPPKLAPEFEVVEEEAAFTVTADMQGDDNVRLGVSNDRVIHIVSDKKASEGQGEGADGSNQQQPAPEVSQRAIPLPESVDETRITAAYRDGELSMNIPKRLEPDTQSADTVEAASS